jgi:hypothetical protein
VSENLDFAISENAEKSSEERIGVRYLLRTEFRDFLSGRVLLEEGGTNEVELSE